MTKYVQHKMLKVGFFCLFLVGVFFRMVRVYSYIMGSVWNMTTVVRERCLGGGGRGAYPHLLPHATATRDV